MLANERIQDVLAWAYCSSSSTKGEERGRNGGGTGEEKERERERKEARRSRREISRGAEFICSISVPLKSAIKREISHNPIAQLITKSEARTRETE